MNLAHTEEWTLRINDPSQKLAVSLRISVFTSHNGFKSISDAYLMYWKRGELVTAEMKAFREIHDRSALSISEGASKTAPETLKLNDCHMGENATHGKITSNRTTVQWDLKLHYKNTHRAERKTCFKGEERHELGLQTDGIIQIADQKWVLRDAWVTRSWQRSQQLPFSRIWAASNHFVDGSGKPVDFQFEGTSLQPNKKKLFFSPQIQDYFFLYQNQEYRISGLLASRRSHSIWNFNSWEFRAEHQNLSFRGRLQAENRELLGLQWIDTTEKSTYRNQAGLGDLVIHVYHSDKLESTVNSKQCAFVEMTNHEKNPYAPYLF